jgi:predicted O-methyltransferase YrrM
LHGEARPGSIRIMAMDISAASVDPISKATPDDGIRPLVPLVGSEIAGGVAITAETMAAWRRTSAYSQLLTYFESYPPRSLMGPHSRAILFSLIRMLRPKVVAEVGTLFAGTTETLARALWENGQGVIHTTDPFGADRCPAIIGSWPRELQEITEFHALNSMDFFGVLAQRRITLDMVLVDGSHDYEYALFDLQMAARLLGPGGIIVMDNSDQTGPFHASREFVARNPAWQEIGGAIAAYDPSRPFDQTRSSMPPGTFFVVLRSPDFLSISAGPHGWGQVPTALPTVSGLRLDLPDQVTSGTLSYEVFLRGFADGNRDIVELKNIGSIRLDLRGSAMTFTHPFTSPLHTDMTSRYDEVALFFEINLSWQADPGSPPLALLRVPTPFPS